MAAHLTSDTAAYQWVHTLYFDERDQDGFPVWRYSGREYLFDEQGQVFSDGRSGVAISRPALSTPSELPVWCRKPDGLK